MRLQRYRGVKLLHLHRALVGVRGLPHSREEDFQMSKMSKSLKIQGFCTIVNDT